MMGTLAGVVGSAILVGIAAGVPVLPTFSACLIYSVCLVTMLGCSAAYNLASNVSRREFLRQLDHAAIFLMIAATYTPFRRVLLWRRRQRLARGLRPDLGPDRFQGLDALRHEIAVAINEAVQLPEQGCGFFIR
jgi:hypothetical protein